MTSWKFRIALTVAAGVCVGVAKSASAEEFVFGFAGNGLTSAAQLSSADLTVGGFTMQLLATGPDEAWLYESNGAPGLGIGDTKGPVSIGGDHEDFHVVDGVGEGIVFSFDRPGVLTGLDFDGVKDENYEYFQLQTAGSPDLYFFDSFEGSTADPELINVPGVVAFLNEFTPPDDGILDLAIPFAAGQTISITYGELGVGLPGNGGRLQRIVVAAVPEPATFSSVLIAIAALGYLRSRSKK